ncbi:hypothetical protein E0198_004410 [Clavispora lusitaniae]|nr:hypothetical protein E0198_004410 [Clavispora lusitaniae]
MGKCITVVKLVGFSSLGMLTASLTYQSLQSIPELIRRLNNQVSITSAKGVLDSIFTNSLVSKAANVSLAGIATALFTMAFKYSPPSGRHPYLVYSALGAPLALAAWAIRGARAECNMLKRTRSRAQAQAQAQTVREGKKTPVPPAQEDEEDASALGRSYVHVSDDSTAASTPASSTPGSPQHAPAEVLSIEQEVEDAILKKAYVHDLQTLQQSYFMASAVSGVGLAVCAVGMIGDLFFL